MNFGTSTLQHWQWWRKNTSRVSVSAELFNGIVDRNNSFKYCTKKQNNQEETQHQLYFWWWYTSRFIQHSTERLEWFILDSWRIIKYWKSRGSSGDSAYSRFIFWSPEAPPYVSSATVTIIMVLVGLKLDSMNTARRIGPRVLQ
jgi:hypothetical protein